MTLSVTCSCGAKLQVPESAAGKKARCPKCQGAVPIPASTAPGDATPEPPASEASAVEAGPVKNCIYCGKPRPKASRTCPHCGRGPRAAGDPAVTAGPGSATATERDLEMEAHLRAIAIWYRLLGGLLVVSVLLLILVRMAGRPGRGAPGPLMLTVLALMGAGSYAVGHALMKFSNKARMAGLSWTALCMSVNIGQLLLVFGAIGGRTSAHASQIVTAVVIPLVGLALGGAYLWAFFNGRAVVVCSEGYAEWIARSPEIKPPVRGSKFFWVPMVALVSVVVLVVIGMAMGLGG